MIKHIVMWKFKDFAENNEKKVNLEKAKELLLELKVKIPCILSIEVGINIDVDDAAAYDIVLYSKFLNIDAAKEYQNHPEHKKVAEFITKVRENKVFVDYEVNF